MNFEKRLSELEHSFRPADDRGRCPSCGTKYGYVEIDDEATR